MSALELQASRCAICDTEANTTELYPANFNRQAFNPAVFSARRLPDRIHYRLVKCNTCGLVRSDPVADPQTIARLYARSTFDYKAEVANLQLTYGQQLRTLEKYGVQKGALLEVGCGNGFFLEVARAQGYAKVRGVEPGATAVAQASAKIRPDIVCDVMRSGLFEPKQFDVICMFQTLDHLPQVGLVLEECFRLLKPGGLMLCINHNVEALSAKLLREASPIVDIEHTYLYSPATITRLFSRYGFLKRDVRSVSNRYTLHYLLRLTPLPGALKEVLLAGLSLSALGQVRLSLPLGNMRTIAQKPYHQP